MKRLVLAVLLFAASTAMSIWGLDDKIAAKFPAMEPYIQWAPLVTATVFALLIITAILEIFSWLMEIYFRVWPSALRNVSLTNCKMTELPEVVELAKKRIGTSFDIQTAEKIYRHNRRSIWKVKDTQTNKIIGYFCILPLTARGEEKVLERDLIGEGLDIKCFAKNFRKGTPFYIGSIAGLSRKGGAAALESLKSQLVRFEASKAYARPMTAEGVRLVKKFGFNPVSKHDKIGHGVYVCRLRQL